MWQVIQDVVLNQNNEWRRPWEKGENVVILTNWREHSPESGEGNQVLPKARTFRILIGRHVLSHNHSIETKFHHWQPHTHEDITRSLAQHHSRPSLAAVKRELNQHRPFSLPRLPAAQIFNKTKRQTYFHIIPQVARRWQLQLSSETSVNMKMNYWN